MGEGWKNKIAAFFTAVTVSGHEGAHSPKEEIRGDDVAEKSINSGTGYETKLSSLNKFVDPKNEDSPATDSGIDIESVLAQVLPNLVERPEGVNTEEFYSGLTAGDYFFVRLYNDDREVGYSLNLLGSVNPGRLSGAEKYNVVPIGQILENQDGTYSLVAGNSSINTEGVHEDTGNNVSADSLSGQDLKSAIGEMLKWHRAIGEEPLSDSSLSKEKKLSSLDNKISALGEILESNLSHLKISDKEKERIERIIRDLKELRGVVANSSN